MSLLPGIEIDLDIGVGDAIQFTSVPENYFRHTGKKMVDVNEHWVLDYNPYIVRGVPSHPDLTFKMWGLSTKRPTKLEYMDDDEAKARLSTYTSNAEVHARILEIPTVLNRPRLYRFEDFPFQWRDTILVHTNGRSHGQMPEHVAEHIVKKYGKMDIAQVGHPDDMDLGIPKIVTGNLWDLAEVISQCRMFIGMDSGPSWIAACYPDVIVKRLRMKPALERLKDWIPLDVFNNHSHWDDRAIQIFNPSEDDVGFTSSYKKI